MDFDTPEDGGAAIPMLLASPEDVSPRSDRLLQEIAKRWFEVCPKDGLPGRDDIDPMRFPRLLASSYLLDCLEGGDFKFRVAGSVFRELHGYEITGQRASDIFTRPDRSAPLWADMRRCASDALPVYRQGFTIWRAPSPPLRFQRVMLPLGEREGKTVKQILGAARIYDSNGAVWS